MYIYKRNTLYEQFKGQNTRVNENSQKYLQKVSKKQNKKNSKQHKKQTKKKTSLKVQRNKIISQLFIDT